MKTLRELMDLSGRVAVVTGGAGHIGRAMCAALAELGAAVVVVDVNAEAAEAAAAALRQTTGAETLPLVVDLADEAAVKNIPAAVLARFGRIDVLVNNAAFVGTSGLTGWGVPFEQPSVHTWRKAMEVNLTAAFALTQARAPAPAAHGRGAVVNVASIYGVVGPDMGLYEGTAMGNPAAYAASKGGLIQLTRWLSTVLGPNIRVNCLSPGGVARGQADVFRDRYVERTPLKRMATEEDFKGTLAWLASDLSAYVTGQNIMVDGGWTVW
jgi:NAD(P)-dependent dehydrogenase (short-subunit alcohol dehydrogenase family)